MRETKVMKGIIEPKVIKANKKMTKSTSEKSCSLIRFSNDTVLIPQFLLLLGTT